MITSQQPVQVPKACVPQGPDSTFPRRADPMKIRHRSVTASLFALLLLPLAMAAQQPQIPLDAPLPVDPQVTVGELDNGLRYYIRANQRPENRAELRLVVNAGSILEDEDQQGLAHFVEHMAFNGTKNFDGQELTQYLESIGMRFGPDLNASTSFDETIYMLTIPMDSEEVVTTAFRILEDWATNVLFDPAQVDRERGVVIEEWRGRRGAQARVLDLQVPVLLRDSHYADRLPIGKLEVLQTAPPEALQRYYERWYRPDLMAVVAVGDFDPDAMEALIHEHFAHIPVPATDLDRPRHPVPGHDQTLFHSVSDPELTSTRIEVLQKQEARRPATIGDYRQSLVEQSFSGMLNERFGEMAQRPGAPFLGAGSGSGSFVRTADMYSLIAIVPDGGVERGLEALLSEAERVARHGFTTTELERYKLNLLRSLERGYAERERTNSGAYASAYVDHFLNATPIPGIEFEFQLAQILLPGVAVDEVDRLAREWITEENRVVLVSGPEKEGVELPAERELRQVLAAVEPAEIEPWVDSASDEPLVATPPTPSAIVEEILHEDVDVHEWRLGNGVRVLLKSTDFRDDEIVMRAYAPGGLSLAADDDYLSASLAAAVVQTSGVGSFSSVELQRALAGKAVGLSPSISEREQGFSGNASPRDLETLLQLVYLYFTAPREDADAVQSLVQRLEAQLANRGADPNSAFADTLQQTLAQYHPRSRPATPALLQELDTDFSHAFFRERFRDAGDFTFVLVGNLDFDAMRPLVTTYLGGLPSTGRSESARDTGLRPPDGVIEKVVRRGLEPRSQTQFVFTGPMEYSREGSYALRALSDVLSIRLREILREDLGGTYGVQVAGGATREPEERYTLNIFFGAAPERLDELADAVLAEIERLKVVGPSDQDLVRVRETQRRERETNLRQNGYWVGQLLAYDREGRDFGEILTYERLIEGLSVDLVRTAARDWLLMDRYVRVSLFPADDG